MQCWFQLVEDGPWHAHVGRQTESAIEFGRQGGIIDAACGRTASMECCQIHVGEHAPAGAELCKLCMSEVLASAVEDDAERARDSHALKAAEAGSPYGEVD